MSQAPPALSGGLDPIPIGGSIVSFIQVRGIRKEYPGVVALNNVDLSVKLGTIHVIAGENGAGKSTLVKILTGVESPTKGEIQITMVRTHLNIIMKNCLKTSRMCRKRLICFEI